MEKVRISIDVQALPASAIMKADNGKKYIIVEVTPRRDGADQYGKTHTVSVWDKASDSRIYVGSGKAVSFGDGGQQGAVLGDDDLPL